MAASGDFETIPTGPDSQPGFLIKANDVEILFPKKDEEAASAAKANQEAADSKMPENTAIA